ncbi:hypothetical protein M422DRAFT_780850 [Sphaerobolus stellatus SS14]|uniref:Tudor domain-containing protein n=1 Tax=Sphaerobolus stellatus (strain SS14) TaxID=990650 RepID=A0A0C9UZA5_SPHS4|nr:hypothetical protein M422DRAFT_780850 [Sphaerobolus stellatus SS14]
MDKKEFETYQVQLEQVEIALATDPANTELTSLRDELKVLIDLTKEAIAQAEAPKPESLRKNTASLAATIKWKAGDEVLAKYSGDGQCVVSKGYNNTEQLKALPANYVYQAPPAASKQKLNKDEEDERERKKKKHEMTMTKPHDIISLSALYSHPSPQLIPVPAVAQAAPHPIPNIAPAPNLVLAPVPNIVPAPNPAPAPRLIPAAVQSNIAPAPVSTLLTLGAPNHPKPLRGGGNAGGVANKTARIKLPQQTPPGADLEKFRKNLAEIHGEGGGSESESGSKSGDGSTSNGASNIDNSTNKGSSVAAAIEISSVDEDPADTCIEGKRLEIKSDCSPSHYQTLSLTRQIHADLQMGREKRGCQLT